LKNSFLNFFCEDILIRNRLLLVCITRESWLPGDRESFWCFSKLHELSFSDRLPAVAYTGELISKSPGNFCSIKFFHLEASSNRTRRRYLIEKSEVTNLTRLSLYCCKHYFHRPILCWNSNRRKIINAKNSVQNSLSGSWFAAYFCWL